MKVKQVMHETFLIAVPKQSADDCLALTNQFIEWLRIQCNVYLRQAPQLRLDPDTNVMAICFRLGLTEKTNSDIGRLIKTNAAWVELDENGEIILDNLYKEK